MSYYAGDYDVAVIGAGHAGCEAGLASARLGMKTLVFSISLEAVANMPCNPHIGGSSKGHLVREIDALGGEMGKNIDKTMIQIKMLNTSKGPAVHSLRAQADRKKYHAEMKHTLEKQENLFLKQGEIVDIKVENGKVVGIETAVGAIYGVKAVIVATGTYLKGKIFMGEFSQESGPDGVAAANKLSESLKRIGVDLVRFKTGTPARINKRSIDFSKMEVQKGDENIVPFSFEDEIKDLKQVDCYLTYTNEKTHQIIRDNLHRSPLYGGEIKGTGPRYCPSIEDKVVRFSDKPRHQAFVEPVGISFLESLMPYTGFSGSRIQAATHTGPQSGPRPASSTPAKQPYWLRTSASKAYSGAEISSSERRFIPRPPQQSRPDHPAAAGAPERCAPTCRRGTRPPA